ncbi:hypothetical protein CF165_34120 [Amycolatopsis vastitatis]|uniref:Aminotransferase n=2 Tax=Amycolatopsis vastitatis TaxID=1905142 RepID=A0A229SUR8_9PSEU|nr:hypothetical protein CF165_34120 [Amycolatopsis vastitatis]
MEQPRDQIGHPRQRPALVLFLDETYQEFSGAPSVLNGARPGRGLVVYRSFAKAFGLAGIRVGCLIAEAGLIAELAPARRFMPIDAVGLAAAAGVPARCWTRCRATIYRVKHCARPACRAGSA